MKGPMERRLYWYVFSVIARRRPKHSRSNLRLHVILSEAKDLGLRFFGLRPQNDKNSEIASTLPGALSRNDVEDKALNTYIGGEGKLAQENDGYRDFSRCRCV